MIENKQISISLGAGVSVDYGSKQWNILLDNFYKEIQRDKRIDNIDNVKAKIGNTNIINGQFAKDNLKDFMHSLYDGLYGNFMSKVSLYPNSTLKSIIGLINKLKSSKKFNIITYIYDNFLEQELDDNHILYRSIYSNELITSENINIFHPHGFLPYKITKGIFQLYQDNIVFSESDYHKLYNDFSNWSVNFQHFMYKNNIYLFVGTSLTDPNLRKILETTRIRGKNHIALMLTD